MALSLITPPAFEPLSLGEAKDHLRVTGETQDAFISELIVAATAFAESFTGRALITQTRELVLDGFRGFHERHCELPMAPLQSVTSVTYTDTAGVSQVWDASKYQVDTDSQPGRLVPAFGEVFPSTRAELNTVRIRFVAGYGNPDDVPGLIKRGMLFLVGHLFAHREEEVIGTITSEMKFGGRNLLAIYRVPSFS